MATKKEITKVEDKENVLPEFEGKSVANENQFKAYQASKPEEGERDLDGWRIAFYMALKSEGESISLAKANELFGKIRKALGISGNRKYGFRSAFYDELRKNRGSWTKEEMVKWIKDHPMASDADKRVVSHWWGIAELIRDIAK